MNAPKLFWWQWPWTCAVAASRAEAAARCARASGTRRAAPRGRASARASGPGSSARKFVAQGQQAGRLEPDRPAPRPPAPRVSAALRRARGPPSPPPDRSGRSTAGGRLARQHRPRSPAARSTRERGAQIFGLELAVERVGEQQDIARAAPSPWPASSSRNASRSPGAAGRALARSPARRGGAVRGRLRRLATPAQPRGERRVARQHGHHPLAHGDRRADRRAPPAPRSSCAPCRRRSGIRGGTPCRRRKASSRPRPPPRPTLRPELAR